MNRKYLLLLVAMLVAAAGCQQPAGQTSDTATTPPPAAEQESQEIAQTAPALLPNLREPGEGIISGGQPTPEHLQAARDAGYRTVINLRLPEEKGVANEVEIVSGLGMEYVSLPIAGSAGLTRENTEAFALALETAEYPIVLHCGSGNRIGALFALKAFWIDGKSAEEALRIGIDSGMTRLEGAVKELLEAESGT